MAEVLTVDGHVHKTLAVLLFKDVQNSRCLPACAFTAEFVAAMCAALTHGRGCAVAGSCSSRLSAAPFPSTAPSSTPPWCVALTARKDGE